MNEVKKTGKGRWDATVFGVLMVFGIAFPVTLIVLAPFALIYLIVRLITN